MSLSDISNARLEIMVESLLATVEEAQAKADRYYKMWSIANSGEAVLQGFLADKHPELSDELFDFVLDDIRENIEHGADPSSALSALAYHRDSFSSKKLDDTLAAIRALRDDK